MEPQAGAWQTRRKRGSEATSQDISSAPPPTGKEKPDKGATQPSAADVAPISPRLETVPEPLHTDKRHRTSVEDVAELLPSSDYSSTHGDDLSLSNHAEDETATVSSLAPARIRVNPVARARVAARLITQEEEDEFNQRSTAHDDHLIPEGFVSVGLSLEVFEKFEADLAAMEGPICIGVLYRFDMTNFRKGEVMANYFQRPNLLDVILGVAILGAKHKGKPFYLPLFDDEDKTKVPRRQKWDLFLALLGAERDGEQRAKKCMAKEEEKLVHGAQELMKHVMRHNTAAHPRHLFDPSVGAWLLNSDLPSYEFSALLKHFLPSLDQSDKRTEESEMKLPYASHPKDRRANAKLLFRDMIQCMQLSALIRPRLVAAEMMPSMIEIEMPLTPLLAKMENIGVHVDVELLKQQRLQLREHLGYLKRETRNVIGEEVELTSPQKLSDLLFNKLKMRPPLESSSPRPSVSESVLKQLSLTSQHAILPIIMDFRHCQKLSTGYVDALISKAVLVGPFSCLYPIWHHTDTATGRLSASEPAIQNLPRVPYHLKRPDFFGPGGETRINVRDCIIARPKHVFIAADYMQLEARVLAHFSQDPFLLSFLSSGRDLHRLVAARMRGKAEEEVTEEERETAKHIVYGILYGIGPTSLSELLQVSPQQAKAFLDDFLSRFPLVKAFISSAVTEAKENNFVRTAFHRRRLLPNANSQNAAESSKSERQAVNSKVQGTAADIAKAAMIRVDDALRREGMRETKLVMQIHDELVYEVPEPGLALCAAIIRREMETSLAGVRLPVRVYSGGRFGSMRPWREEAPHQTQEEPSVPPATTVSASGSAVHT